ncbi:MAG: polyprenyl synthetase family protein [Bacteroidia bacterium]
MKLFKELLNDMTPHIEDIISQPGSPRAVYDPISYILELGGKRIRPVMVLAAYRLFKDEYSDEVFKLAQSVEMFHNFTLLHDDIMDNSPLRRGKETVHVKWDDPTSILSGDLLQVEVYEKLTEIGSIPVLKLFNAMARELCEGQMNDMQFEKMDQVANDEYLNMIRQKTSVLIGFSLQSGALLGGATEKEAQKLYDLGISIGLSFQLMDDYLDSYGETAKVGKRIGGDILEKKKTYLWNEMWNRMNLDQKKSIEAVYSKSEAEIITFVKDQMESIGAKEYTLELATSYTQQSLDILEELSSTYDTSYLKEIVELLAARER